MERQYRLPVTAMVEILKASVEQVVLRAQLPALPGISKKACLVQLIVGQGNMCFCAVTTPGGEILLKQQEAYQALLNCGDLEWRVEPFPGFPPPESQSQSPSNRTSHALSHALTAQEEERCCIPILRMSPLPSETLAAFTHSYRMVLALVDGRRSIHEIARLLSKSPADIQQMLASVPHLVHFFTNV